MADPKRGWKQFQKLSFDSKRFSKRVKKAEGATLRHARKFIVGRLDSIRSVRRHIIGWLTVVGVLLVLVALQVVWFQHSYQTTTAAAGGTYAEASLGSIDTLNPLYASSNAEIAASHLLFSSLYSYDQTGTLQGDLAESIKVDANDTRYTVKLHDTAVWHDGTRLTAKDVVYTVNLIKSPSALSVSPARAEWQDIKVLALDDYTVQFTLPTTIAAFKHALTFSILPEHILGSVEAGSVRENNFSRAPVGSGPFTFRLLQTVDVKKNQKVLNMAANSSYYKGMPLISRFEVHSYNSPDDIVDALQAGEVSAAADLSGVKVQQVDQRQYIVETKPINSGVYALLNVTSPVLKDKQVRQALQAMTDTAKIRTSLGGKIPALDSPFVAGQLSGADVPHAPAPSVVRAESLLEKAGYAHVKDNWVKDGEPLAIRVVTVKNADFERALEVLAGQWRKAGIVVTTDVIDASDRAANFTQNTLQPRNYDVLLTELSIGADPDVYAYWHSSQAGVSGRNFSNYSDQSADLALASARARLEPDLRNVKYKSFAKQWIDDVPAIGLYQPVVEYVYNKRLVSMGDSAKLVDQYGRYANILYWSVADKSVYKTP